MLELCTLDLVQSADRSTCKRGKAQSVLFTALNPAQHADKRKVAEQRDERMQCCALLDASLTVKQRSLANVNTPLRGMSW